MSSPQNIIFRNVQVIDGNEDEAFAADVLVRDGEIAAVERGGGLPEADDREDPRSLLKAVPLERFGVQRHRIYPARERGVCLLQ